MIQDFIIYLDTNGFAHKFFDIICIEQCENQNLMVKLLLHNVGSRSDGDPVYIIFGFREEPGEETGFKRIKFHDTADSPDNFADGAFSLNLEGYRFD